MRRLKAAALYFALVFGMGFLLGSVRVPFVVPWLGVRAAELLEMPIMFVAIVLAARHVIRRFDLPPDRALRLAVGFIALALLVAAELSLTVVLSNQSPAQYIASRDPISGSVYLALLGLFALMPLMLARVRLRRAP